MKKISYEKAVELLNSGIFPKCKTNSREPVNVTSIAELDQLKRLGEMKVQSFELFEENVAFEIPDGAIDLSIDDAIELLADYQLVYCKREHANDVEEITTTNELMQLCRSCNVRGDKFVLFWYV